MKKTCDFLFIFILLFGGCTYASNKESHVETNGDSAISIDTSTLQLVLVDSILLPLVEGIKNESNMIRRTSYQEGITLRENEKFGTLALSYTDGMNGYSRILDKWN